MTSKAPSVLCPIDFSEFSRLALAHAIAIANHFGARLVVLSVDDPLLTEAAAAAGFVPSPAKETRRELQRFCGDTLASLPGASTIEYRVAVGKPATEILREARDLCVDLIVMSSHGRSGMRKLFFGSTTERVLRETSVPVLVTRERQRPFTSLSELAGHMTRVIAPIDLTESSAHHLSAARAIATALSARLIVVHVLEPLFVPYSVRVALPGAEHARRSRAEEKLNALLASIEGAQQSESMVLLGEPSEEIVKLADARNAGLIVMALHSAGPLGPRMGSVTYRVLCQTNALVLALPPHAVAGPSRRGVFSAGCGKSRASFPTAPTSSRVLRFSGVDSRA
jgi:nucleotide-binding universal stress UspA family protein